VVVTKMIANQKIFLKFQIEETGQKILGFIKAKGGKVMFDAVID
jgi:hypothetical protein